MWITNAKEASVKETAVALGFTMMTPRSISPCPSCGVEARGTSDKKRGPVGFSAAQDSWKCHACSASGDVVDFVSIHSYGSHYRDLGVNEKIVVRNWFARHGYCKPIYSDRPTGVPTQIEEKKRSLNRPANVLASRPPIDELKELWGKTKTLEEALQDKAGWSDPLVDWLFERKFSPALLDRSKCVRILANPLEHRYPKWWPHKWASAYRVAAPVFEPDGTFASIHCRDITESKQFKDGAPVRRPIPKTRWPMGYEAGGLLMANGKAIKIMRGDPDKKLIGLLVCEGITDFMRACSSALEEDISVAIVGGTSGSFKALSKMSIPKDLKIFVATDPDKQGDDYAAQICEQLPGHILFRVPIGE